MFAISGTLTLPLIFTIAIICLSILQFLTKRPKILINKHDLFLGLFLILALSSSLYNNLIWFSSKSLNHTLAYFYVIILSYFLLKLSLLNIKYDKQYFYSSIIIGVFLASSFGCFEFALKSFLNIQLDEFLPRQSVNEYDPTALGEYIRIRSFTEESGHFAFYLELMFPLSLLIIKKKLCHKMLQDSFIYIFSTITLIAFILTFSSAGFGIVIMFYVIIFLPPSTTGFIKKMIKKKIILLKLFITCLILAIISFIYIDQLSNFWNIFYELVFGKLGTGSADDRSSRIATGLEIFNASDIINKLIGYGPGAYEKLNIDSIVSLYFTYLLEVGYLGVFCFFMFIFSLIIYIHEKFWKLNKRLLLFSIACGLTHFLFISNYWYPWIWFVIITMEIIKKNNYQNKENIYI